MKISEGVLISHNTPAFRKSSQKISGLIGRVFCSLLVLTSFIVFFAIPVSASSDCGACSVDSGDSGSDSGSSVSAADSAIALIDKAKLEQNRGNVNASVLLYENATRLDPFYIAAWTGYSDALRSAGNLTGSRDAIDRAIQLKSGDADLYIKKGDVLVLLGNTSLAVDAYKKAESMNPNARQIQEKIANLSSTQIKPAITETVRANITAVTTPVAPPSEAVASPVVVKTTKSPLSVFSLVFSIIGACGLFFCLHKRD